MSFFQRLFPRNRLHFWFPVACFVLLCLYCFRFFVDDTYINFIAAKNLTEFGKFSPNLEHLVNPTTANFQMILAALVYAISGPDFLEPLLKLIAISTGIGIIALIDATLSVLGVKERIRGLASLFLATAFPFILWTASAMDTTFDAALIVLCCYCWFQDLDNEKMRKRFLFSAFLLVLGRLDFAILSLILLAGFALDRKVTRKNAIEVALYYLLPLGVMLCSLKAYYGTVIPTPIQKASLGLAGMIHNFAVFGALYFVHFCRLNLNFIAVFSLFAVMFIALRNCLKPVRTTLDLKWATLGLATLAYFAYIISQGSVHMMFAFRFYTPLIPILTIFLGFGLALIESKLGLTHSVFKTVALAVTLLLVNISTFFFGYYRNLNFSEIPGGDFTGMKNNHVYGWIQLHEGMRHAGVFFGSIVPPGSKIFLGVAGIIPYFMDKSAYDNGLLGAPEKFEFDYVLNGCDSIRPVPPGFVRHQYKKVDENSLYYPFSSWCVRQVFASKQPRLNSVGDDRLSQLPLKDITGFEGILDMAADLDCRYFVENKMWSELVLLLNKLNDLSDTKTGHRELVSYRHLIPEEFAKNLTVDIPPSERSSL